MLQSILVGLICLISAAFLLGHLRSLLMIGLFYGLRRRGFPQPGQPAEWPTVVVQLPVYREQLVMDRLLTSVLQLDYPADKWSVQIIDDSEGEDAASIHGIVQRYEGGTVPVQYLHRDERVGYKSGALNYGTARAHAELIALFDAEFVPRTDFLRKTVPFFQAAEVGCVQGRFGYLNAEYSPLTQLQAAIFDKMFCLEAAIRSFLGVAGFSLAGGSVWRKSTIEELGGWREAPFTSEDIDLSLRAKQAGWFIAYQHEPISSAEQPDTFLSYKIQQRKWARGVFRNFLDHSVAALRPKLWRTGWIDVSLILLQGTPPLMVLLTPVVVLYILAGLERNGWWMASQLTLTILFLFPPMLLELAFTQRLLYPDWKSRVLRMLGAVPLAIGLSVSLLAGFWDTAVGKKTEFIRTPKQGDEGVIARSQWKWLWSALSISLIEIFLGLVALAGVIAALIRGYPESLLPLAALSAGYLVSGIVSCREIQARRVPLLPPAVRTL